MRNCSLAAFLLCVLGSCDPSSSNGPPAVDLAVPVGADAAGLAPPDLSAPSRSDLAVPAPVDGAWPPDGAPPDGASPPDGATADDDVTFFAFGDPQYGGGPYDKNTFNILALNQAPALTWPVGEGFRGEGKPVGAPRGVLIAGDLTQNGASGRNGIFEWYTDAAYSIDINKEYGISVSNNDIRAELGLFLRDYGLRGGDGLSPVPLKWRVFEGYGNHDFDVLQQTVSLYFGQAPARDIVSIRNQVRASWPELRRMAPGNAGHYSWQWGRVRFVHLNLVGADAPPANGDENSPLRDPQDALAFLRDDLATLTDPDTPVITIMHYGFDAFGDETRWWDDSQRKSMLDVLRPYNVMAILHGHTHETCHYTIDDGAGKTYDVISLGSPYYEGQATNNGHGHFAVFHIQGDHLDAADVHWLPLNPDPAEGNNKDLWSGKQLSELAFKLTPNTSDGWGGWKLSK